jgi:hypothetical protein
MSRRLGQPNAEGLIGRGLWGEIFILDFGEHRRDRAFQSARKNEDRIKCVPGNGNEVLTRLWFFDKELPWLGNLGSISQ